MNEALQKRATELQTAINKAVGQLKIDNLEQRQAELQKQTSEADFWIDNIAAQKVMQEIGQLQSRTEPWNKLQRQLEEIKELLELGDDDVVDKELDTQLNDIGQRYDELKQQLQFAGPYDEYEVIVGIYAGAGGTDAQDWAQMLLRMYIRWSESHGFKVEMISESPGEEAGLKSVTFSIGGDFIYGRLKGEHGVHRLVRLSPFNSDNLRQTSFAKVEVLPKVQQPEAIDLDEKDLKIDVYRSGGKGGQSVNTTDSAVRITHVPTGIVVAIQNERSQLQNKETAMTILRSKLAQLQLEQHAENTAALKGPNQSAEWGNQIRSYVLHPYKMVKDLRTRHETSDVEAVLNGALDPIIQSYLYNNMKI